LITQLEVPLATVAAALQTARDRGITTILNPAPARPLSPDLLELVDWLIPNEVEATILAELTVDGPPSALVAARHLAQRGPPNVVITLGSRGAVMVTPAIELTISAIPVVAVDATAAGDAFIGGLAVSLARGKPPADALAFASACGAFAATRAGAQPSLPRLAEVDTLLASVAHLTGQL
jgi:ribokinase